MLKEFLDPSLKIAGYKMSHPAWALAAKRAIDILGSLFALSLLWPLFLAVAVLIKLSSKGTVFYRGERVGALGKPFTIYKFRSMIVDAERMGGTVISKDDSRITRFGLFLRKTKIDELPQFINVLLGDMSLVGPRPEVYKYLDWYSEEDKISLLMKPGLTDYASIRFANLEDIVGGADNDPEKFYRENIMPIKNRLRVNYVKNWSLGTDFVLLFKTFMVVLKKLF